jgi:hypothetical protein
VTIHANAIDETLEGFSGAARQVGKWEFWRVEKINASVFAGRSEAAARRLWLGLFFEPSEFVHLLNIYLRSVNRPGRGEDERNPSARTGCPRRETLRAGESAPFDKPQGKRKDRAWARSLRHG